MVCRVHRVVIAAQFSHFVEQFSIFMLCGSNLLLQSLIFHEFLRFLISVQLSGLLSNLTPWILFALRGRAAWLIAETRHGPILHDIWRSPASATPLRVAAALHYAALVLTLLAAYFAPRWLSPAH